MKNYYRFWTVCLLLFGVALGAQAQVTGTVKDLSGEALIGVSVLEKGSTRGTITDLEGRFQLTPSGPDATLVFSYVGFLSQEVPLNGRSTLDVTLEEDVAQLQDVVVIGFGTEKKVNLSGAVDQIDAKALESRPIANVSQGLQGLVPNLNVQFNSGEPGQAANINIRGITSINGGGPLILIDGVPSSSADLNRLAPQDVATYSVIKDASAAAIYGARAAFGVILITTKTGQKPGVHINYGNNLTWGKATVLPDRITDPYIFSRLLETSTDNTPWDNVNYSDQFYEYARQRSNDPSSVPGVRINPTDPTQWEYMGNRDWARYFLSDYTFSHNHDLSVSGANADQTVNYFLSGNYNRQNSALSIRDDYFDRYSFRSKVSYDAYPWLRLGNNTFLSKTVRDTPAQFSLFDTYNFFPTSWDQNPDGTWANTAVGRAAASILDGGETTDENTSIQTQFNVELSFWQKLLKVNADYTYRRRNENYKSYQTPYLIGYGPGDVRQEGSSSVYRYAEFENYNVLNVYATLQKDWGVHSFTALAGFNEESFRLEAFSAQKLGIISPSFPVLELATGESTANDYVDTYALRGAFYRLNYILKNRYIFELNGRYDGSSRFPREKRFGFFPSASAAWNISQEPFMQPLAGTLSLLKLRASYGSLGNQLIVDAGGSYLNYGYVPSMEAYLQSYLIGGARPYAIHAPGLVSPNYTWEKVNTANVGLDLGLFNDRLNLNVDVYQRNTLGMLTLGKELPGVLGASEPRENAADLRTNGWEASLLYRTNFAVANSPFSFNARMVLSDSRSTITRFDNPSGSILQYYKGMELGEIWGLKNDGLFETEDQIATLDQTSIIPWGALSIVPGWPRYQDLDGNGVIEKGYTLDDTKDLSVIGNATPRLQYGLDLSANWKGFDARVFFQGIGKRDYYPLDYLYWGFYQQPYGGGYQHLLDFYRPADESAADQARHSQSYLDAGLAQQNLDAAYPILQAWLADRNLGTRIDQAQGLAIPQTQYLLNAAYLRLKNVTVGYTLPTALTDRWKIASLRIFVSGDNLTEWSALKKLYDPEAVNTNIYTDPGQSPDRVGNGFGYPFQRRYSVGLNVNF
ncbi:TonB-linked outer membrane protein, SusC/RagA family [Catalinimonas alkaloidigena]|uniref:TonB-linked outer membrane protein, SusC/RagA family n=1 Tax=Catalinimonas alkaloidigena TaxID=1075417 RepID=A0A1G9P243_9BACT|nr:TonB-dependent receptor [Catalinimonas alkaloidigena]SDL92754.1 TonB-linked outer membrane protein, SusC/RagA family [Catalinimonas alkaloidigena]